MTTTPSNPSFTATIAPPLSANVAQPLAMVLSQASGLTIYPRSIVQTSQAHFFYAYDSGFSKFLGILSDDEATINQFSGQLQLVLIDDRETMLRICPRTPENAVKLRTFLPFLVAKPCGLQKSAGCGDRLGMATQGHIRAFRATVANPQESDIAAIFAQQSIRENDRTGRTPQEVMDDAMWGVFEEGWRHGFGGDADHLKNTNDIDVCVEAGYTFYTVDPGEFVDDEANVATLAQLNEKAADLPWDLLDTSLDALIAQLTIAPIDLGDFNLIITEEDLLRAVVKYGHAVAHTVKMYRHLVERMDGQPFDFEMSVDETETITSLAEHVYIVSELRRLDVEWVSLAPRYVGTFEKGVDYIGDLDAFEASFAEHFAVAQTFGPYKLSIHSGSDKFSIYPITAKVAGDVRHLKTAGTSYLEALRAIGQLDPVFFRSIVAFAIDRYPTDRASYHVSAEIAKMPALNSLADADLPILLEDFHAREILHVTFGSVLNNAEFRVLFFETLRMNEETYYDVLEAHFVKHLSLFQ